MDNVLVAHFAGRLEQIRQSGQPHLCRWTRLDVLMMQWALRATDSHAEAFPESIAYLEALMDLWGALRPFLLEFSEYRSARELADAVEATWLWDDLLDRANDLIALERKLEE